MNEVLTHHNEAQTNLSNLFEKKKAGEEHLQRLEPLLRDVSQKVKNQRTVLVEAVKAKEGALAEEHECSQGLEKVITRNLVAILLSIYSRFYSPSACPWAIYLAFKE